MVGLDPFPIVLCSVCSTLAQTGADLSSMDVTHHFMCNSTGTQSAQISSNILSICEVFPDEINELLAREAPEASKTKKDHFHCCFLPTTPGGKASWQRHHALVLDKAKPS